jgi:ElaB/YqjD/DUF883 family membrane-anchored ribosome-binding protein
MINRIAEAISPPPRGDTSSGKSEPRITPDDLLQRFGEWRKQAEETISTHPGAFLAAAAAIGLLLGWWTKRR